MDQKLLNGDLPRVQKVLADGGARITDADHVGNTALLHVANGYYDSLPMLKWLLKGGGACITDRDHQGNSALLLTARNGKIAACQWLLEHGGC
jgi:ankyrin repeat protein